MKLCSPILRRLFAALAILAIVTTPLPALAGGHRSHGGAFFSVEIFAAPPIVAPYPVYGPVTPYYPYPAYAYAAPPCSWQPGYWVNQPSVDAWGRYIYVQQWVPAQYVCY